MSAAPELQADSAASAAAAVKRPGALSRLARNPAAMFGFVVLAILIVVGAIAPFLGTVDPSQIDPTSRNKRPGTEISTRMDDGTRVTRIAHLGTDSLGRDVYSRIVYGARISLVVGLVVAVIAVSIGLFIGLVSGYIRWLDGIVMRVMDGLMAIPGILLAIALVALWGAGLTTVITAIAVPEVPRVVRLVRSVVLSIREEPYVEAAISIGTPTPLLMIRHILPNTVAPIIVQATYIAASAILVEAILSFLGVGIPSHIPTWGNIMAEGRAVFRILPHNILYPGIILGFTVLAINMLGDGLRDTLDPKMSKRV